MFLNQVHDKSIPRKFLLLHQWWLNMHYAKLLQVFLWMSLLHGLSYIMSTQSKSDLTKDLYIASRLFLESAIESLVCVG